MFHRDLVICIQAKSKYRPTHSAITGTKAVIRPPLYQMCCFRIFLGIERYQELGVSMWYIFTALTRPSWWLTFANPEVLALTRLPPTSPIIWTIGELEGVRCCWHIVQPCFRCQGRGQARMVFLSNHVLTFPLDQRGEEWGSGTSPADYAERWLDTVTLWHCALQSVLVLSVVCPCPALPW